VKRDMHLTGRAPTALVAVTFLLVACGGSGASPASSPSPSVAPSSAPASQAAFDLSKIEASVAYIQTQGTFVTADGVKEQVFSGSGFVVDGSGFIVTNNHVVTGGAFWKVSVGSDKTLLDAQLIGVSECSDLAVLKVSGTFPALVMAGTNPTVGEPIYVAGHPNGDPYTLTNGIVAKPAAAADTSWASVKNEIQITAQTYPGNSGSPVLDAAGQVVGVQYSGGAPGSAIAGESFAIASSEAKGIIEQIKASGNLDYIGLNGEVNSDNTGIAIVSVAPGSPSDKAGIEAGDLLTNFNGTAVGTDGTKSTYCSVLRSHKADATFSVTVSRGGQTFRGEINGRALALVGGGQTPGSSPTLGSPSPGGTAIDQLRPFVPSAIWSTCRAYSPHTEATVVQGVACDYAGTDGVWYDLYGSPADLQAAIDAHVQNSQAKPSTDMATDCASGSWSGTWSWTGQASSPGQDLLCAKNIDAIAYVQQADPNVNVLFVAQLKNGDQAAMYKWWLDNTTVVEPGR
jgi:S1-C subfamily serine protease